MNLLIARNPDPDSTLPYLLRLPLGDGLVFRTKGTWPRTSALYCHPVPATEWPEQPDLVERVPLRACARRGAAIDVVTERGREHRSEIVFTNARGREMVFWQSPRTRKQARPDVRIPTARAAGIEELEIVVDAHERYAYTFAGQQVRTVPRGLPCGDYAVSVGSRLVAAVERKSLADLVSSLTRGRLRFAIGELAALPRAAVVVEDRYSRIFALERVRPALVADGLAELQVRWPSIPIVFCETRKLAEEWTYRYLAAAHAWAAAADADEHDLHGRHVRRQVVELRQSTDDVGRGVRLLPGRRVKLRRLGPRAGEEVERHPELLGDEVGEGGAAAAALVLVGALHVRSGEVRRRTLPGDVRVA